MLFRRKSLSKKFTVLKGENCDWNSPSPVSEEEMVDQEDRENVITVELAFQRELAYRKKVAMFEPHPNDDELLPLPVEFLSPCQSQTSTQISGSGSGFTGVYQLVVHKKNPVVQQLQHIHVPQTFNGQKKVEVPSPCQSQTSTQISGSGSGFIGVNQPVVHTKNPVVQQLQQIHVPQTFNGQKKVKLAGQDPFSNSNSGTSCSLSGMKRAACPSNLEPGPSISLGDQQPAHSSNHDLVCKICQIFCSGPQQYEQHIGGKKHHLKAQEAARRKVFEQREWCSLCKIWCMKSSLKQHIEGQRHQKKLCIG